MDLTERLAKQISDNTGIKIEFGYLIPEQQVGLVPTQGSHVIDEDYAGNQSKVFNYEIVLRTDDAEKANVSLFLINKYLEEMKDIKSKDESFIFERVDVPSGPSVTEQDERRMSTFSLEIQIFVTTNKYI